MPLSRGGGAASLSLAARRLFGDWVLLVDRQTLRADTVAGLLGALLVLPQGIAFATLAGLPPEVGLYTAIVPCIVAALFGSSWHVMSGPTNALSLALLAMLAPLAAVGSAGYIELAFAVTLMVGLIQLGVGGLRLGALANFISPSVLHGFTSGAALLIAVHALKDLVGLDAPAGQRPLEALMRVTSNLADAQPAAIAVSVLTLVVALGVRGFAPRWPGMLLGLVAGVALASALAWWVPQWAPVRTVGALPTVWPSFHVPAIEWQRVPDLIGLAAALTIVALGQSLAIAKAVAARSGQRLDINREFTGQGLSNLVGGVFSCYVSCGSLNRSVPNLEAGARTPLAAVFASLLLLVLVAVSASLLALIPMAAIGALLLVVAWTLFDLPRWRRLLGLSREESAIALVTLVATLTMRLEIAILLGTIVSLVVYLYRTSRPALRTMGFDSDAIDRPFVVVDHNPNAKPECPQLKLLRMEGEVYFGAVPHVTAHLDQIRDQAHWPRHMLVMAKSMNFIDLAGDEMWRAELRARRAAGGGLYFHRPRPQVMSMWASTGFLKELGAQNIFPDKHTALATIVPKLDLDICATCTARIFRECPPRPAKDPPDTS